MPSSITPLLVKLLLTVSTVLAGAPLAMRRRMVPVLFSVPAMVASAAGSRNSSPPDWLSSAALMVSLESCSVPWLVSVPGPLTVTEPLSASCAVPVGLVKLVGSDNMCVPARLRVPDPDNTVPEPNWVVPPLTVSTAALENARALAPELSNRAGLLIDKPAVTSSVP